jgi:Tfp pilus assembly protein PilN
MVQQINLYDEALKPRRERWRAAQGAWIVVGTLVASAGLSAVMDHFTAGRLAEGVRLQAQVAVERQASSSTGGSAAGASALQSHQAELQRLRTLESGQRKVHAALDREAGAGQGGYSAYFQALSRQAHPALWLTGFGVGADGQSLEIRGRMTDAAALPDYLHHLNNEPQFKGRSFEQLTLKVAEPRDGLPAGFTEFVLRSAAPAVAGTSTTGGGQ